MEKLKDRIEGEIMEYFITPFNLPFQGRKKCPTCFFEFSALGPVEIDKFMRVCHKPEGGPAKSLAYFDSQEKAQDYVDLLKQDKKDQAEVFWRRHNRYMDKNTIGFEWPHKEKRQ